MTWKETWSKPDLTPKKNPFDKHGRVWVRTLGMRCPYCGDTFYAYQPEDDPSQPGQTPRTPEKRFGIPFGKRDNCGALSCESRSEADYMAANEPYQAAVANYWAAKDNPPQLPFGSKPNNNKKL